MKTGDLPLEKMAPHLAFEFHRFETAAATGMFHQSGEWGGLIREALQIHFRNLLHFFYGDGKFEDDVLATDYTNAASSWKPTIPSWLGEYKLLAHLTYERVWYKESDNMFWWLDEKIQH